MEQISDYFFLCIQPLITRENETSIYPRIDFSPHRIDKHFGPNLSTLSILAYWYKIPNPLYIPTLFVLSIPAYGYRMPLYRSATHNLEKRGKTQQTQGRVVGWCIKVFIKCLTVIKLYHMKLLKDPGGWHLSEEVSKLCFLRSRNFRIQVPPKVVRFLFYYSKKKSKRKKFKPSFKNKNKRSGLAPLDWLQKDKILRSIFLYKTIKRLKWLTLFFTFHTYGILKNGICLKKNIQKNQGIIFLKIKVLSFTKLESAILIL